MTIRGVEVTAEEVHALAVLMREDRSLTMRQIAFGNALGRASMAVAGTLSMDREQAYGVQRALARMLNIGPNLVRLASA